MSGESAHGDPDQDSHALQFTSAAAVRRRVTVCLFLFNVSVSGIVSQVYPQIVLHHFHGDDRKASKYHGWLAAGVSSVQLIFIPALSGLSDVVGRRPVIAGACIVQAAALFTLAVTPNSLIAATVSRLVTSLCFVTIPMNQAIMVDIAARGGQGATHGLGIAYGVFALATSIGDIIGGFLSENSRSIACLISGGLSVAALLSLLLYGWNETAPVRKMDEPGVTTTIDTITDAADTMESTQLRARIGKRKVLDIFNPFTVLVVFWKNRALLPIASSYFLFVLSLNVFATGYNYLDLRFHWSAVEISYFFATFNGLMALSGGWFIRFVVPRRLTEENGSLFGIGVQACASVVEGFCFRGWMLYPALAFGAIQNITEPCLQAVMATFVEVDHQGGLQGAITSLRIVGEGVAAPVFTQTFSAGSAAGLEQAPFFLAAIFSVISFSISWRPLRRLDGRAKRTWGDNSLRTTGNRTPSVEGEEAPTKEDPDTLAWLDGDIVSPIGTEGASDTPVPQAVVPDFPVRVRSDSLAEMEAFTENGGVDDMTRPLLENSAPAWK